MSEENCCDSNIKEIPANPEFDTCLPCTWKACGACRGFRVDLDGVLRKCLHKCGEKKK